MSESDFARLERQLRHAEERLRKIELEGSGILNERIQNQRDDISRIEEFLLRQDADKRADRRAVLVAIISAAVAIAVAIFSVVAGK